MAIYGGGENYVIPEEGLRNFLLLHSGPLFSDVPANTVVVYLEDNQISMVRTGAFRNLAACGHLLLPSNAISMVEPGAFSGLTNLASLRLTDNRLTEVRYPSVASQTSPGEMPFSGLTNLAR